jgi:DNA-binding CsgD family transcriptional regulator
MISLREFSELLQVLYATPLHHEQWERFLTLLCEHTGSKGGFLICADSRLGASVRAQNNGRVLDASATKSYREVYAPQDPYRLPMLRSGRTGVVDCEALVPTDQLLQTGFYQQIIAPAGLRYPTLIVVTCTIRRLEGISFWRTADKGPMDSDGNHLLELLVPHIQAMLEIRHVLSVAGHRIADAEVMADASSTAAFLLSPSGEIRHCNAAAKALLQAGDGLTQSNGTLVAAASRSRSPLRNLLQNATTKGFSQSAYLPSQALSLDRTSGLRPLQLLASPVPPVRGADTEPTLLLLVTDPDRPIHLRDDLMRSHYNLTPAETEVANGLLTGYSLEEIAVLRRVTVSTVRDQLKSIFSKTATNRQADLVRLLLNLPHLPSTQ